MHVTPPVHVMVKPATYGRCKGRARFRRIPVLETRTPWPPVSAAGEQARKSLGTAYQERVMDVLTEASVEDEDSVQGNSVEQEAEDASEEEDIEHARFARAGHIVRDVDASAVVQKHALESGTQWIKDTIQTSTPLVLSKRTVVDHAILGILLHQGEVENLA